MAIEQEQQSGAASQLHFSNLSEAVAAASYVEQVLSAEHQWITNRLSWLFVSQSFCITAYVILISSSFVRPGAEQQVNTLRVGLPLLGIVCCVAVGIAVMAAGSVARQLANERGRLSRYINQHYGTKIPLVGVDGDLRDLAIQWTHRCGALPQLLPWVLATLWLVLLVRVDFGL